MPDKWIEPTALQREQCTLASHEIIETLNRLIREGMDYRVVLAALGSAAADMITSTLGATAVGPWHDMQAKLIREALRPN